MSRLMSILLVVALWSVARAAHADSLLASVDEVLKEPILLVREWETDRWVSVVMVTIVFVLGAVVAIIHTLPETIAKVAAVALGSSVTLLTGLNNAYFDFDHRQYKALASQGRLLLAEINIKKLQLANFPQEQRQAREAIFEEIRRHANAILSLPASFKVRTAGAAPGERLGELLVASAHAQAAAPDWVTRLPVDDENLYFLGDAQGRDYLAVVDAAKKNAYDQARAYLARTLQAPRTPGVDSAAAAAYLLDSARVASTYAAYDRARGSVHAYALVALSKRVAESDLRWYGAKTNQSVPPVQQQVIRDAVRTQREYLKK